MARSVASPLNSSAVLVGFVRAQQLSVKLICKPETAKHA